MMKVIFPSLGQIFLCVLGNKAWFDDSLPKIYFDLSIAMANNALALQVCTENINMIIYQKLLPRMGCQGLEVLLLFQ